MEYDFGFDDAPYSSNESYSSSKKTVDSEEQKKAKKKKGSQTTSSDSHDFSSLPLSISMTSFTDF